MQVLDGCARLPVGHEVATFKVEGDVQEVGGGGVALGLKLEIAGGEDGDDLLHDLLGREITRKQGVVPVEAALDGEVGELGEEVQPYNVTDFCPVERPHRNVDSKWWGSIIWWYRNILFSKWWKVTI